MFEGFEWSTSFVSASQSSCTGMAEAGARKRASESGYRKVARGAAAQRAAPSRRRKTDRGSRAEAGLAATELSHFLQATFFRRSGWCATSAGQQEKEEGA